MILDHIESVWAMLKHIGHFGSVWVMVTICVPVNC